MYRCLHIDGSFLAFSRWSAAGDAMSERFCAKLLELRYGYAPEIVYVAWDAPGSSMWRRQIWQGYKAGRPEKSGEWHSALWHLKRKLQEHDVVQVEAQGAEADDCIATLCRTRPGPHLIYTADKDLLQLVRGDVALRRAATGGRARRAEETITADALPTTPILLGSTLVHGLDADGWRDLLTLAGDSVDKVPGVPGLGPRRALDLLEACPAVVDLVLAEQDDRAHEIVAATDASAVRWLQKAIANRRELELTRKLIALRTVELEML